MGTFSLKRHVCIEIYYSNQKEKLRRVSKSLGKVRNALAKLRKLQKLRKSGKARIRKLEELGKPR